MNYKIGQDQTTRSFKAGDTWTVTANIVNSFSFAGLVLDSLQTRTAPFSIFDFGTIKATKPAPQFQETGITVTGYSGWGSGGTQPPGEWLRNNYEMSDVLTWNRGSHSLRLGGQYTPYTQFDSNTCYQEEPLFTFSGSSTGNGLSDLLLGQVNWRVLPRLTLKLGLRWEPFTPYTDPVAQQVGAYIPGFQSKRFPLPPAGLAFAGDAGFPDSGINTNLGNFAPRLGAAWTAIAGKHMTTIRGGWGMFYIMPFARLYNNFVQNAPFSPSV